MSIRLMIYCNSFFG